MITLALLVIMLLPSAWGQCVAVDGEWVTAGDVAKRLDRFAGSDPNLRLIRAPFPGARRLVNPATLPGGSSDPEGLTSESPFCVERQLRPLTREEYWAAIDQVLLVAGQDRPERTGESAIGFELVDYDHSPLPSGKLEFLVRNLPPPVLGGGARAEDPILWRGKLLYSEGRSMPVWARIRLWVEGAVCILAGDVARGAELKESDCVQSTRRYSPFAPAPVRDSTALNRTTAARHLSTGELLYPSLLVRKPDVEPGRPVELRVVSGGTRLRFAATPIGSAHTGEHVMVTNPATGKRIEAQVVGTDSVEVHLK
jgi:flagella basal body P-ring formation protein FlgA